MKLSSRTRYGTRAMFALAQAYPDRAVSVRELARNQQLSPKYLEQIVAALKTAGLLKAARGMHGGYTLARPPETIKLSDILRVLEGPCQIVDCVEDARSCRMSEVCPTRETWIEVKQAIDGVLERTTLQDLVERSRRKGNSLPSMYHI